MDHLKAEKPKKLMNSAKRYIAQTKNKYSCRGNVKDKENKVVVKVKNEKQTNRNCCKSSERRRQENI